jgi:2-polyprenyl-6-methoxyphenol hydroxylase-like FAD-dependent oxidoreductase
VPETLTTTCCIAGGGPAGILLGYLLARSGVDVVVLEKHKDFFRDFRGDTIHASTLQILEELGLLEEFLSIPHDELHAASMTWKGTEYPIADFSRLPTACKFIALMPQWDFLNFLSSKAKGFPCFRLLMETEANELITEDGLVVGVRAEGPKGPIEVKAGLTIAADGRSSTLRQAAELEVEELGVPIDVLWFRVPMPTDPPQELLGFFTPSTFMVLIARQTYFQTAFLIKKGTFEEVKSKGIEAFRDAVVKLAPFLESTIGDVKDWDQVKLLSVQVNRLPQWSSPGLLCIGDAAHAMSPVGGVGINLAVQDAVAAANILAPKLLRGNYTVDDLAAVQDKREWPVKLIQGLQIFLHGQLPFGRVHPLHHPPFIFHLTKRFAWLRRLVAFAMGVGPGAEKVETKS